MKKLVLLLFIFLLIAAGYLGYAHLSGGAVPTFGLPLGGEKAQIRKACLNFFEHVKFRNTTALLLLVSPQTNLSDIKNYLVTSIGLNPNNFDLNQVKIHAIEIDSAQKRARARVNLSGINLQTNEPVILSKVMFLFKQDTWLIDIEHVSP